MIRSRLSARLPAMLLALPVAMMPVAPATAQALGGPVTKLLGQASDGALDKLSQPGAFYRDKAIRILLPGPLKKASKLMKYTDQAGLTDGLVEKINNAAGLAAKEAKPVFRSAISEITLRDAVDIAGKGDGGSRYLREKSGSALLEKVRPLIATALAQVGAYKQIDRLAAGNSGLLGQFGVSRDTLTNSVTEQALNGIFSYMGTEERRLRADPLSAGKGLLKGL